MCVRRYLNKAHLEQRVPASSSPPVDLQIHYLVDALDSRRGGPGRRKKNVNCWCNSEAGKGRPKAARSGITRQWHF